MSITSQAPHPPLNSTPGTDKVHRIRFSREMYHALAGSLLSKEGYRYELFNGDILETVSQNEPHSTLVMRFLVALLGIFGPDYLRCQMPVVLADDTEPEPDVMVTAIPSDTILASGSPPSAEKVRLVVEVSVSTLEFDAGAKAVRYAQSGIPECWVLDVAGRALIVHRDPTNDGYRAVTRLSETETVSPLAALQASLNVVDFLP